MSNLRAFFLILGACLLTSLNQPPDPNELSYLEEMKRQEAAKRKWVEKIMQDMTLEEKIGQFFMVAAYSNKTEAHTEEIERLVREQHVGGVIFFKGSPYEQAVMTNRFQDAAKIPLFVSIDGEWGLAMRLDSTVSYPKQITLGAVADNNLIYEMGQEIGRQCRRVGVNINLAPVVDVNNNPNNPVINYRSFGEDKFNVAMKGLAYMQGMQDMGVMAVAKHFPGHGDTDKDSHKELPVVGHSMERLKDLELYPFDFLIHNDLQGVMAAHIHVPAIDSTKNIAVSVSKKGTTELLKDKMGFQGLVFSDALNMKGVSDYFEAGEVDAKAFIAGNDILLFSVNVERGINEIKDAITEGDITLKEIDERLANLLGYKYHLGLHKMDTVSLDNLYEDLNNGQAVYIRNKLYKEALTLASNKDALLPLNPAEVSDIAAISIGSGNQNVFQNTLSQFTQVKHYQIAKGAGALTYDVIFKQAKDYDYVVVSIHDMSWWASKTYGVPIEARKFINDLSAQTNVIVTVFGSPYSLKYFDKQDWVLVAYEDKPQVQEYAARAVFGEIQANGFLPVSASDKYTFGTGFGKKVEYNKMPYSLPGKTGFNEEILDSIDLLVREAIYQKATPGCEVLIAKDDQIVYHKTFGHHDYSKNRSVTKDDLYDIASITKIASTTLAVMKLYEEKKLKLDKKVSHYLPDLDTLEVGDVSIQDILMHQAGLRSWIPFYLRTVKDDDTYDMIYCDDTVGGYCVKVASDLFIRTDYPDTMWNRIITSSVRDNKRYVYSDLGMYLLMEIIQDITGMPLDEYVFTTFYEPMGLERILYNPLDKFSLDEIVPTEDDKYFRHQLVHGYVHDMGAAMMGGIGGHAGLFATAEDLAEVMRMLLHDGMYEGKRFLKAETISHFTTNQTNLSRRGIGFDKPEPNPNKISPASRLAPYSAFGHLGFTGTCVWADPENDLIYIFLSNRIHPTMENKKLLNLNTRTRIHTVIYKALEDIDAADDL